MTLIRRFGSTANESIKIMTLGPLCHHLRSSPPLLPTISVDAGNDHCVRREEGWQGRRLVLQEGRPSFYLLGLDDQSSVPSGWQLPSWLWERRRGYRRLAWNFCPTLSWPKVPWDPRVDTGPPCSICKDHHIDDIPWSDSSDRHPHVYVGRFIRQLRMVRKNQYN